MPKPQTLNAPRSLFRKPHYVWIGKVAETWPKSTHMELAYAFYCDNNAFKPVRWFQSIGYARDEAEEMHERTIARFNHQDGDYNA